MSKEKEITNEILDAREGRACRQRELIDIYKTTLVSFTLNIPGQIKNNSCFAKAHRTGINLLETELEKCKLRVVHKEVRASTAGTEAFFSIAEKAYTIKKITAALEDNHMLGRLFDFDVFSSTGEQIDRLHLGLSQRKCLLCNEDAKICSRSRKHSIDELLNKIYEMLDEADK